MFWHLTHKLYKWAHLVSGLDSRLLSYILFTSCWPERIKLKLIDLLNNMNVIDPITFPELALPTACTWMGKLFLSLCSRNSSHVLVLASSHDIQKCAGQAAHTCLFYWLVKHVSVTLSPTNVYIMDLVNCLLPLAIGRARQTPHFINSLFILGKEMWTQTISQVKTDNPIAPSLLPWWWGSQHQQEAFLRHMIT